MRTLNRPMFRYGGPIKEGVMSGIREPKKNGGSMREAQQWNTVGSPVFPKDSSGRAHHVAPAVWGIGAGLSRVLPWAARGAKAAWRFMKPTAKFRHPSVTQHPGASFKYSPPPYSAKEIAQNPSLWWKAIKENPGWTGTGILSAYNAPSTYEGIKGGVGVGGKVLKQMADLAVPDWIWDQDKWEKERAEKKKPPSGTVYPGENKIKKVGSDEPYVPTKSAKELRNERIQKYRDIMDIKGMNKDAAYNSLIEASRVINESEDFKGDIKSGKLINQAIQAASKAFDKPKATKDAIDTLILKGEIEKDIKAADPAAKLAAELTGKRIALADKQLAGDTLQDTVNAIYAKTGAFPSGSGLAGVARTKGIDVKMVIKSEDINNFIEQNPGKDAVDFMESQVLEATKAGTPVEPGAYVVKDRIIVIDSEGNVSPYL